MQGTGNRINDVEVMEYVAFLKLADGTVLDVTVAADAVPHHPKVEPGVVLHLNQKYPVRYLPAYPRWFVVDQGTPEDAARRSACIALNVQLAELTSRALLSPADATLTTARDELQKQVVAACAR